MAGNSVAGACGTHILALVRVGSEEYLCTEAWFAPYVAIQPIVPPMISVQKVCRFVGSVSKLWTTQTNKVKFGSVPFLHLILKAFSNSAFVPL